MLKKLFIYFKYKLQTKILSTTEVEDFMKDDETRNIKLIIAPKNSSLIDYRFRDDIDSLRNEAGMYPVIQVNEKDSTDEDTVLVTKGNAQIVYSFNSESENLKRKIIVNLIRQIINVQNAGGLYG